MFENIIGIIFSSPKKYALIIEVIDTKGSVNRRILIRISHLPSCNMLFEKYFENIKNVIIKTKLIKIDIQNDVKSILLFLFLCSAINLLINVGSASVDMVRKREYVGKTNVTSETPSAFKYLV